MKLTEQAFNHAVKRVKVVRVPQLRDHVRPKKLGSEKAPCVNEMSLMMDCWKINDFNQSRCAKEMDSFHNCMEVAKAERAESLSRHAQGLPQKGSRFYPSTQVNQLLKKHPQPLSDLYKTKEGLN